MMMTQQFPAHQGMPQHPGLPPGHPMAQAQHPNMGVQGPGMVQQMHPGVSAAAGPQVSQPGPMMGGMPPGATNGPGGPIPNAHALQHLNPAQAHILQQQQQQYGMNAANNNQLLQQQVMARQQQRIIAQQQLAQQQQQQQHHGGGIPVSLPAGTQGLSQAQLSAMQNPNIRGQVNMMHFQQQMPQLPPNIQQQQQFLAMQAQAQAAAQAAAAQANNQQGQHTPQQRAAVPPQSVTPQPQQGPPAPPGSATPSQQSNPPNHSTPQPPSHQGSQPPPQPTPNPQHQQIPSAQQALAQQQPQPQAQSNQQQQPQPSQAQPQNGQQQTGQPQGPVQMTQQQQQAMSTPEHMKMQQMMMEQQRRANMNTFLQNNKGSITQHVNSYFETLSNFQSNGEDADHIFWQDVVNRYYNTTFHLATGQPWGSLRQGVLTNDGGTKSFEVNALILPRFYVTLFNNGIRRIQTHMEATQEFSPQNGYRVVSSPRVSFIYWFTNDCQLFVNGALKVIINPEFKFDLVEISVFGFREFIPRNLIQQPEPVDQKPSPRVAKNASKKKEQKQAPVQPIISPPPESLVNVNGLPNSVQCFLEIAETWSSMTSLIFHSTTNPGKGLNELLRDVNFMMSQQGMNAALQQQAQGQRTPNINGPSQFASPSVGHMGLAGAQASPHLGNSAHPSPAQNHLMGPAGMIPQQSQASLTANGSQGTSANTSPNVSNKRRRASTVKTEGDDGAEANGAAPTNAPKVRASPKVGAGKRHKATA